MSKFALILIVLVSVVLSVGLSLVLQVPGASQDRVPTPDALAAAALRDFESRLAILERRVNELRPSLEAPSDALSARERHEIPSPDSQIDEELDDALEARLARLEQRLASSSESDPSAESTEPAPPEQEQRKREEAIRDAKAVLSDPGTSVADKIAAHEALRRVADAYTPAMVQDLVVLGANDPDAGVRANVWRCFDGASPIPELVPSLLQALSNDVDPAVRAEASETLGNYLDDPAALSALEYAAEFDVSREVRLRATRTLSESTWLTSNR